MAGDHLPTLDAIVAEPELARGLSKGVIFNLILKAQSAQLALGLMLLGELEPTDELLDVREAARRIGVSPVTLAHRAQKPPYVGFLVPTGTRVLRFSARGIKQWQRSASEAGSSTSEPAGPTERRKRRQSPTARSPIHQAHHHPPAGETTS